MPNRPRDGPAMSRAASARGPRTAARCLRQGHTGRMWCSACTPSRRASRAGRRRGRRSRRASCRPARSPRAVRTRAGRSSRRRIRASQSANSSEPVAGPRSSWISISRPARNSRNARPNRAMIWIGGRCGPARCPRVRARCQPGAAGPRQAGRRAGVRASTMGTTKATTTTTSRPTKETSGFIGSPSVGSGSTLYGPGRRQTVTR